MSRNKKWTEKSLRHGVIHARLASWRYFYDYVHTLLDYPGYIFRGQRSEHWKLESTLDRLIKRLPEDKREYVAESVMVNFIYAARGRRSNSNDLKKDEIWSLGQHHGLATPLLDWTTSPYVAAFFALAEDRIEADGEATVWAAHQLSITEKSEEIAKRTLKDDELKRKTIRLIRPLTDENQRLLCQSGCFLHLPEQVELENWVKLNFKSREQGIKLFKITIPAADREIALVSLNRMNINFLSLFPDLYGASKHSNLATEIPTY